MKTLLVLLTVGAAVALAGTADPAVVALGSMTERADAVLVVSAAQERPRGGEPSVATTFRVDEVLRGSVPAGQVEILRAADAPAWDGGARYLAFLRAAGPETWVPLHPALGLRRLVDGEGGIPLPEVVRAIADTLGADGAVTDPDRLRALLVTWMCDAGSGVSRSAANDFVRHAELHAGLTSEQGAAIVAAFEREPVGKGTKRALAFAVAATRHPAACDALLRSLMLPRAPEIRSSVVEALGRLDDARAADRIEALLEHAGEEPRVSLLAAAGRLAGPAGVRLGRAHLADPSPRVRAAAARALGLGARDVRRAQPDTEIAGRRELEALGRAAGTENEVKAALWALAQLDQPEAYAFLRSVASEDEREFARRWAARYLKSPRQSLILERE